VWKIKAQHWRRKVGLRSVLQLFLVLVVAAGSVQPLGLVLVLPCVLKKLCYQPQAARQAAADAGHPDMEYPSLLSISPQSHRELRARRLAWSVLKKGGEMYASFCSGRSPCDVAMCFLFYKKETERSTLESYYYVSPQTS
jgi:hypothetical protein